MSSPITTPKTAPVSAALPAMRILWGRKLTAEAWEEQLLCTQPARFEEVRKLAARDGFGHFRESVDNGSAPDFRAAVAKG